MMMIKKTKALIFILFYLVTASEFVSAENTYLVERGGTFKGLGSSVYNAFTVSKPTTYLFRYVSDSTTQAAIIPVNQLQSFIKNKSFTYLEVFDKNYGTKFVTLNPGKYYVAARSLVKTSNSYYYEVDYMMTPEMVPGYHFQANPLFKTNIIKSKVGSLYQSFSIIKGSRYFLDGCNTGLQTYIIPSSQLSNFKANRTFTYYHAYSSNTGTSPGYWEIKLPPGTYYLAFKNKTPLDRKVTYSLVQWVKN
jgi:hypothetical protein